MEVMDLDNVVVLFVVVIIVQIAEWIASGTWQSFYFRVGLPLFKKSIRLTSPPDLSVDDLSGRFKEGRYKALHFKQISIYEVAFRESLFSSISRMLFSRKGGTTTYTQIMHGLIRYDETTRELHVIGFANWVTPFSIILLIAIFSSLSLQIDVPSILGPFFIVIFLALFAFGYFKQVRMYTAVIKTFSSEETYR